MTAGGEPRRDGPVLADRPVPGVPRPYEFPAVATARLENGLTILSVDMPGRPLVAASLVLHSGAADEPSDMAGATVLAARALSEGTERYDAIALVEAAERLGASLHADAGWDSVTVGVDVPADRLDAAMSLVAEMALRPTFPAPEVERLRDERLNDLLQAKADPRRRADEEFVAAVYDRSSPYHRPAGGLRDTVETLAPAELRTVYGSALDPGAATLVVAGQIADIDLLATAERLFGAWEPRAHADGARTIDDTPSSSGRIVRVIHRPGSVQTEIRIGHRGLPRRIDDYHAVSVMSAILGGLFNSRLNMRLREEKGYTYGAGAGFDLRRGAGPFIARAAVNTEVTAAAVEDTITELERMRESMVSAAELRAARDFLVGVFPLRFETASAVVGAISGLVVHDLPVDELVRYRAGIEAVGSGDVAAAARAHLHVDRAVVVLVGDADAVAPAMEAAGLGEVIVEREEIPPPGREGA